MPRLSAILDKQMISDVVNIHDKNTFDRPIYAGNAIATVKSEENIKIMTIRPTAFEPFSCKEGVSEFIELDNPKEISHNRFLSKEESKTERPELASAKIIVSGVEELDHQKTLKLLKPLQTN